MIIKKLFLLILTVSIGLVIFVGTSAKDESISGSENTTRVKQSHSLIFFDEKSFNLAVAKEENSLPFNYPVSGGIIPHHLFPSFIIANFFSRLAHQAPKTIILVGPNHFERGQFKVLTSLFAWQTPFGQVEPNKTIVDDLLRKELAKVDEEVLPNDHSLAAIMPFIKYYMPNSTVVPLLLSGTLTQDEAEILSGELKNFIDKNVVVVTPVDFSHYLNNKQAQEKDKLTLEIIKNFDYRQLFTLNNDYLDSPPSIATLLFIMQKLKTTELELLYHTNSGEIQNNDSIQTTSYFSIAFH